MRISDWSSDVCSSDLGLEQAGHLHREASLAGVEGAGGDHQVGLGDHLQNIAGAEVVALQRKRIDDDLEQLVAVADDVGLEHAGDALDAVLQVARDAQQGRSEEHTSELQSLMRI